jgi:hypothetical protein
MEILNDLNWIRILEMIISIVSSGIILGVLYFILLFVQAYLER